jgi:hypothetical protein
LGGRLWGCLQIADCSGIGAHADRGFLGCSVTVTHKGNQGHIFLIRRMGKHFPGLISAVKDKNFFLPIDRHNPGQCITVGKWGAFLCCREAEWRVIQKRLKVRQGTRFFPGSFGSGRNKGGNPRKQDDSS